MPLTQEEAERAVREYNKQEQAYRERLWDQYGIDANDYDCCHCLDDHLACDCGYYS